MFLVICFLDVGGTAFLLIQGCFQVGRIEEILESYPSAIDRSQRLLDSILKQNMEISNPHEKMKKASGAQVPTNMLVCGLVLPPTSDGFLW